MLEEWYSRKKLNKNVSEEPPSLMVSPHCYYHILKTCCPCLPDMPQQWTPCHTPFPSRFHTTTPLIFLCVQVRKWIDRGVHLRAGDEVYISWARRLIHCPGLVYLDSQRLLLKVCTRHSHTCGDHVYMMESGSWFAPVCGLSAPSQQLPQSLRLHQTCVSVSALTEGSPL